MSFNRDKFGNIFANKRKLEARLKGVQGLLRMWISLVLFTCSVTCCKSMNRFCFKKKPISSRNLRKSGSSWVVVTPLSFMLKR